MLLKRLYKILGKEDAEVLINLVFTVLGPSGVERIIASLKKEFVRGLIKDGVYSEDPNTLNIEIDCEESLNDIMLRIVALNDLIKLEEVFMSQEKEIFKDVRLQKNNPVRPGSAPGIHGR